MGARRQAGDDSGNETGNEAGHDAGHDAGDDAEDEAEDEARGDAEDDAEAAPRPALRARRPVGAGRAAHDAPAAEGGCGAASRTAALVARGARRGPPLSVRDADAARARDGGTRGRRTEDPVQGRAHEHDEEHDEEHDRGHDDAAPGGGPRRAGGAGRRTTPRR
ncbi:hypothetical protein, partial [Thermomonospora catenispora]|uniref:hypothetical protein n=1 Tax=Thermomonospora catenispora TaxID=2493090 RepID=UPI0019D59E45